MAEIVVVVVVVVVLVAMRVIVIVVCCCLSGRHDLEQELPSSVTAGTNCVLTEIPRGRRRMMELMMKTALAPAPIDPHQIKRISEANKEWHLMFLRSPNKFFAKNNSNRVSLVQFGVNRLKEVWGTAAECFLLLAAKSEYHIMSEIYSAPISKST